jgi:hypothetical protein
MKLLQTTKDGGSESTVWAHWLFEIKGLCSVALLRFENGSRDAYHSHAFNCVSWLLRGELTEVRMGDEPGLFSYLPSLKPIVTKREHLHKVYSVGRSWVLTFRGPWAKTWQEVLPGEAELTLKSGRELVKVEAAL